MNGRDKTLKYGLRQIFKKSVKNAKIHFFLLDFIPLNCIIIM